MIRVSEIKIPLAYKDELIDMVIKKTGIKRNAIKSFCISKKSIDARDKKDVHFVYSFDLELFKNEKEEIKKSRYKKITLIEKEQSNKFPPTHFASNKRPVVVGSGPSGMFAALTLAEHGLCPIVLERGNEVYERKAAVSRFWETGILHEKSNVQFGEGGAGTFSDGKLTTGIKDVNCKKVLNTFFEAGAPEEILYLSKPHIGTDKLTEVVKNIRNKIIALGGEYRFGNKLEGFLVEENRVCGITVLNEREQRYEMETDTVILAIGHSARDTFKMLQDTNLKIIQKPFAIGARIEHKQKDINFSQYGMFANESSLGAADYKLSVHLPSGRSGYTFCMCPGGVVVAAASSNGLLTTNGMSEYSRNHENANSALLIGLNTGDFGSQDPLAGMYLQETIEKLAFQVGGKNFKAPAQLVGDLLQNKASKKLGDVSPTYLPGVELTDLRECLPDFVIDSMVESILEMDKKLTGFAKYDALLTGVETRSSSPIRILRDETFQSNIKGIYPCGEGAGYAGGIMSAATDGINTANKYLHNLL